MEVILLKDVKALGKKGEVVKTKEGYAKNFLFIKNLAVEANAAEMNKLKTAKNKESNEESKKIKAAELILKKLEEKMIVLKVKTGKDGKTFGSVSSKDLSAKILEQFNLKIDKKKISLNPEHIKNVGDYSAKIKLHPKVPIEVKVKVEGL